MTVHDAATWQGKLPAIFLALDDSRANANANSDTARVVARVRCTIFGDTDDDGNPVRSTDASRRSVLA